jgi:hypothetical protein
MIAIDESFIDSASPNADATKNGRGLVLKNKFSKLSISDDETLLFAECQGSGKEPYKCSCDFQRADQPTYRCNCPSRQFPCKHNIGLLFAYVQKKSAFATAAVPEELQAKREKLQARTETKKVEAAKPKVVNKAALSKKLAVQLEGIDLLEKLTLDLMRIGIGNMNAKSAREIEEKAKQLGNAYLPGAQTALHNYTKLFADEAGSFNAEISARQRETIYGDALDQLARLSALVKQGRASLQKRAADPDLKPETESGIAAWLGHAWQLTELKEAGLVRTGVELVQLAFNSHDDVARHAFVDTGIWIDLGNGKIGLTQNIRPYKAAKFIKSDDSFFHVAKIAELCVYPGDVNPRIRWDALTQRPIEPGDLQAIRRLARNDFAGVVKEVKTTLKAPLADKQPIFALNFRRIGRIGEELVAEDAAGDRLVLTDRGMTEEPASCHLLTLLPPEVLAGQTLIARFRHDLDTRKLQIKPLSFVTASGVIRLTL